MSDYLKGNHLLSGDTAGAAHVVRSVLRERYVSPIEKAIVDENRRARKHPCKNAKLLDALRPFVDATGSKRLDEVIDALHMVEALRGMSTHLPKLSPAAITAQSGDVSARADGVYDIDSGSSSMLPMLMLMLLMRGPLDI